MVRILNIAVSVALLWLSSTSVWALHNEYLGIGMGSTDYQSGNGATASDYPNVSNGYGSEPDSSSLKLFYSIRVDNLSLDFEAVSLGDISDSTAGNIDGVYSVDTWVFAVSWHKRLNPRIRFFARIGVHNWEIYDFGSKDDVVDESNDLTYGLGADFDFGDPGKYLGRIVWDHYEIDSDIVDSSDILTFNLVYQWGD